MRVESVCLGELATNCYLITTADVNLLVDPADASNTLLAFLDGRHVDLVINTHGHFDHIGGAWEMQQWGAEIMLHKADLPLVDRFYPAHPSFDRFITDGTTLPGPLRVMHTPGHSPGSIVLVGDGVLFVGDLLFAGSIGRTDLPGGSIAEMTTSLAKLTALPGDYTVYPGHGPKTTLATERRTNPFLLEWGR